MVFLASWVFRNDGRFRRVGPRVVFLMLVSLSGFYFSVISQTGEFGSMFSGGSLVGVGLVIGATVAASFNVFGWRWGADVSRSWVCRGGVVFSELGCAVVALFVASLVSAFVSLILALVSGEGVAMGAAVVCVGAGVSVHTVSAIAWRKANLTTGNLGINGMIFVTPVLSLVWLFGLSRADVARWDYLVIGAAAVVAANVLINFEDLAGFPFGVRRSLGR